MMTRKAKTLTVAAIVSAGAALVLLAPAARAEPMKCSGEANACSTNCKKMARTAVSICLTNCGVRQSVCMKTGCWDNGVQRYCGLAKL